MVISMYIVDRIEDNFVILEYNGKFLEIEKNNLMNVEEKDILYFVNNKFVKDNKMTERITGYLLMIFPPSKK